MKLTVVECTRCREVVAISRGRIPDPDVLPHECPGRGGRFRDAVLRGLMGMTTTHPLLP